MKSESEVAQSCPTLRDPMDCRPPGSSIHGIFQARVLERGAIAFSWLGELKYHSDTIYSQINDFNANSYKYNLLFCFSFFKLELGKPIIKFIWKNEKV